MRRLVLNEAGPLVTGASLDRIGSYLGRAPAFADFAALEAYVRAVCAPFGPHGDDEWTTLAQNVARQEADGTWRLAYDPGDRRAVQCRAAAQGRRPLGAATTASAARRW